MKVSECVDMFDALSALAQKKNLPGRMAYRVAKNIHSLRPIYTSLNDRKNEWLKANAKSDKDKEGQYTLEGGDRLNFVNYMNPILDEQESVDDSLKKLMECDIPDGVEPAILIPLVPIIEEGECKCSDHSKES